MGDQERLGEGLADVLDDREMTFPVPVRESRAGDTADEILAVT